jgi:mono/diheme cytochrome c family protein
MFKKILRAVVLLVVLVLAAGLTFLYLYKPSQVPASAIRVAMTPERIARGEFIFQHLADCDGCHSQRDFTKVDGPVVPSGRGAGNPLSQLIQGLPGVVTAPNITPDPETGIGKWTDGEKIRAIRDGVDPNGRALFPMMPYGGYRKMSDQDVESLVAYMNTLPPVKHALPATKMNFPVNLMIKFAPQPAGSAPPPNRADRLKYGEYLVTIGGCNECHTPQNKGQPITGKRLAGGQVFAATLGTVVTANITPDLDTGIGKWSEEFFLKKFYDYKEYARSGPPPLQGPHAFTLMPWLAYSQLPPEDLSAMYAYLRTVPPVHNFVETHPGAPKPPTAPAVP